MIVSDSPYLEPHLRDFRGWLGFGDLPALDDHIKHTAKYKVSEMRTDARLLARLPDFGARWEQARAISSEVNSVEAEPEAAALVARERALNGSLTSAIVTIAQNARRDKKSKATSDSVYRASDLLNEYIGGIAPQLQDVRNAIAARHRIQDEARRIAAEAEAQKQRAASEVSRLQAATAQEVATKKETQIAVDTRALVTEQFTTQKLIAKIAAPRFLGIPVAYWGIGATVAAGAGVYYYAKKRKRRGGR